jgi:hypothetical protein
MCGFEDSARLVQPREQPGGLALGKVMLLAASELTTAIAELVSAEELPANGAGEQILGRGTRP